MKVCILSMQQIDNMGSLLQSYALKTTIEKLGNEVEFMDIKKRDEDYKLLGNYKQEYNSNKDIVITVDGYTFIPDLNFMNHHAVCRYCGQIYSWDYD